MRPALFLLSLWLLPGALPADGPADFEQAMALMRSGDYAEAYCTLRELGERGDDRAQYALGWMYHNGYGLRIDDRKARDWWSRALERGNADAAFALAQLHEQGLGTPRAPERAAALYLRALSLGSEDARSLIPRLLLRGDPGLRAALLDGLQGRWQLLGPLFRVRSEVANVREGAGTSHAIRFRLKRGTRVLVLEKQGNWRHIVTADDGRDGWIHQSLLEALPSA